MPYELSQFSDILKTTQQGAIETFAVDSRKVQKGSLFFALKGATVDGHQFLKDLKHKGVVGAVVDKGYLGPTFGLTLFRVDDVMKSLHLCAQTVQKGRDQRVVAITGSAGKTTVKEFATTLLEGSFSVDKTPGNANSQIGLPLAILNDLSSSEVAIIEMGMSFPGEISRLVEMIPPDIGLITKIGFAHVGNFSEGRSGIAKAKLEIFSHPKTAQKIVQRDVLSFLPENQDGFITYAVDHPATFSVVHGRVIQENGEVVATVDLPFVESHLIENFMAAASIARKLGVSWEEIASRSYQLKTEPLRFEKLERGGVLFVNDSYNASPDAMKAALQNLPNPRMGGKRIAVFGEMPELGKFSDEIHREVAHFSISRIDQALCIGRATAVMMPIFEQFGLPAALYSDNQKLAQSLLDLAKPGDVILIKGSNKQKLWQIVPHE